MKFITYDLPKPAPTIAPKKVPQMESRQIKFRIGNA